MIHLGDRPIGEGAPVFFIAEAGVNHNGSLKMAKELIDVAVEAGADAVKFQTYVAENVMTKDAEKASYQKEVTGSGETQYEMVKKMELNEEQHQELVEHCRRRGIMFLSTPFDFASIELLAKLEVPAYKISSGDLTNLPFLRALAEKKKPIILSTGLATLGEVEEAVQCIEGAGCHDLILLHCTTSYPTQYTDIGWQNFQSWIHAGFDNILYTPNGKLHRLLTKLAFENLVHPFQPFIIGQRQIGPRFSALYKIPLIFYGENQAEYGNDIAENDKPTMEESFFADTRDLDKLYLGGVSARDLINDYKVDIRDLNPYLPVDGELLHKIGTQVHYLSYYIKWDPQECYHYAAKHTGFKENPERTEGSYTRYSSIDDKIDPLHYYTTFIKFGIGRATYDTSQEIRNGKITREEGVALVRKYDAEFPAKYFKEILEYMDITEERFWEIIDRARSPHLWKKENGEWKLRYQVT